MILCQFMMKKCPGTLGELPQIVTGVLPSRDFEITEAIERIAKTNTILKVPVNKFFPI